MRAFLRPGVVLLVVGVVAVLGLTAAGASVGSGGDPPTTARVSAQQAVSSGMPGVDLSAPSLPEKGNRKLQGSLSRLSAVVSAYGQPGVEIVARSMAVDLEDEAVRVVAQALPGKAEDVAGAVAELGIPVEGTYQDMVQLLVPVSLLRGLASNEDIAFIRLPWEIEPLGTVTGEGVAVIGADDWHAAGFTGTGVKVGILDLGFAGYEALLGSELPVAVVTHSCKAGSDISGGGETHGTAVAEIVHETAPDATLYLANSLTVLEFFDCVLWLIAQDVDIINFSAGFSLLGAGDGTGLINEIVELAKAEGILWVNAAGNEAQQHWMGAWSNSDDDPWHEFVEGDETNSFAALAGETISIGIKWDDPFFGSCNDYDIYLYDSTLTTVVASSVDPQNFCIGGSGTVPIEALSYVAPTSGVYHLAIYNFAADGEAIFHLYSNGIHSCPASMQYCVEAESLAIPADNASVLAVGAVPWNSPNNIESFSSRGPTGDGRIKPDLVAPNRVSGVTFGAYPVGFAGTSAAAPYATGAAALVKHWHPEWNDGQIHSFLTSQAIDLGPSGADNTFGSGRLDLGAPEGATPPPTSVETTPSPTDTHTPTSLSAATATPTQDTAPLPTAPDRPEVTHVPTILPVPTRTPGPTWTPEPTWTPAPTWTPNTGPTDTPKPTFTHTPRPTNTRTPTPIVRIGDASCDGVVNPLDAALILQLAAGMIAALPCPAGGDTNGDGTTNPLDAALVLQFSAGLISTLPP